MRIFLLVVLMLAFVVLQVSVSPLISFVGFSPNFILIFIFFVAFTYGQKYGIWFGFLSGFLCDIFDYTHFGLNMILFLIVGFIIGTLKVKFYRDNVFIEVIIFSITLFCYGIIYMLLLWQFEFGVFLFNIIRYIIPHVLYSSIVALLLFLLFRKIPVLSTSH
jgi:rod shape-determining protein MreD